MIITKTVQITRNSSANAQNLLWLCIATPMLPLLLEFIFSSGQAQRLNSRADETLHVKLLQSFYEEIGKIRPLSTLESMEPSF